MNGSRRRVLAGLHMVLAVVAALFAVMPAAADAATTGKVTVLGLTSLGEEELLGMLDIREGSPLDQARMRSGIKRAFLKGSFDDIDVLVGDGDPAPVTVVVREKSFVRKISVSGDYRISTKVLRSLMPFREESALRLDLVHEAQDEMKKSIALYGYPHADVSITHEKTREPTRYDLLVTVNTNEPQLVTVIKLTGNAPGVLESLRISPGDVYDQVRLREELERIRLMLKSEGYYAPAVGQYRFQNGELELKADAGKRLQVLIDGNSALATKRLMKEVPFFEAEAVYDDLIGEAADRMLSLYHAEGYAYCQVAPVINAGEEAVTVSFFIYEGEKVKVREIGFQGSTIDPAVLKNVIVLKEGEPFNPDKLEKDRESLKEFFAALGYLEAGIEPIKAEIDRKEGAALLSVSIREGERTVIGSVDVVIADQDMKQKLLNVLMIKPGDPYNEVDLADARYRLLDFYANFGYADIDVDIQRTIEQHKAGIVFRVVEGAKTRFGKIIVSGNTNTKYKVIKREVLLPEGEPYNLRSVALTRQRLFKLGLFSEVDIEGVDGGPETRDLLIKVKEANAGAIEFGVGYADYEQFRGFFEVSYRNLMGMNRQASVRTELSSLERRLIFQYTEPWFLDYPLPLRLIVLFENKKEITIPGDELRYKLKRFTASATTEKRLTDRIKAEFAYEYSYVKTTDVQPDVVLSREDIGTLGISALRASIVYDSRDNPMEPTRGIFAGGTIKLASPLLFSESNFIKTSVYGSIFHPLHKRVVLALLARGGLAAGYSGTNELPIVERFFLGGRSSVRGYEQDTLGPKGFDGNPTGGDMFVMGSVELRLFLGKNICLVPFFDFGNVWQKINDFDPTDLKYTAGIGLRYTTPVGPLRVDYGFKLNRDPGESSGEIHFSVGHAF